MSSGLFRRLRRFFGGADTEPKPSPHPAPAKPPEAKPERRGEVRVPIELRVAMKFESVDDVLQSRTVNISEGGMFIATRQPRPEGTRVRIELEVALRHTSLSGVVVHRVTQAHAGREPPGMGVQFVNLSDDARDFVAEILARAGA